MGKVLIVVGIVLIVVGALVIYHPKLPMPGKLPGDILIERENFKVYLPITSCILFSVLISLLFYLINRFKN